MWGARFSIPSSVPHDELVVQPEPGRVYLCCHPVRRALAPDPGRFRVEWGPVALVHDHHAVGGDRARRVVGQGGELEVNLAVVAVPVLDELRGRRGEGLWKGSRSSHSFETNSSMK